MLLGPNDSDQYCDLDWRQGCTWVLVMLPRGVRLEGVPAPPPTDEAALTCVVKAERWVLCNFA